MQTKEAEQEAAKLDAVFPCILKIMPTCIFNKKDPIVLGVEVEEGIAKVRTRRSLLDIWGEGGGGGGGGHILWLCQRRHAGWLCTYQHRAARRSARPSAYRRRATWSWAALRA